MGVLAAAQRALQAEGAVVLGVAREHPFGLGQRGVVPVARQDGVGQREIALVLRIGLVVIDEVAVEVDVVLGHAPRPGEAVRVDGVDQERAGILGQLVGSAVAQPGDLGTRAAMALDAVRAGDQHQHVGRIARAEAGGVEVERLAGRAAPAGIEPRADLAAACRRRAAELGPRLGVALGKALRYRNHQNPPPAMVAWRRHGILHVRDGAGATLPGRQFRTLDLGPEAQGRALFGRQRAAAPALRRSYRASRRRRDRPGDDGRGRHHHGAGDLPEARPLRHPGDDLADHELPACCSAARRDRRGAREEARPHDRLRRGRLLRRRLGRADRPGAVDLRRAARRRGRVQPGGSAGPSCRTATASRPGPSASCGPRGR